MDSVEKHWPVLVTSPILLSRPRQLDLAARGEHIMATESLFLQSQDNLLLLNLQPDVVALKLP